jgi:hypothetical protein
MRSVWKNLTGLDRDLTSTPSDTFGINWNADCEPGLITQHQCPTSLMLLWLNGSPCSNVPTSCGKPSQQSGGSYSSNGWIKFGHTYSFKGFSLFLLFSTLYNNNEDIIIMK